MPAFRSARSLFCLLWLVWACGTAHDRDEPEGAGSPASPEEPEFDAGSAPDRNAVTPGRICRRLAEIQCEAERACCDSPRRDKAACLTAFETSCTNDALADRIAARPEAAFDPAQAEEVFGELERLA